MSLGERQLAALKALDRAYADDADTALLPRGARTREQINADVPTMQALFMAGLVGGTVCRGSPGLRQGQIDVVRWQQDAFLDAAWHITDKGRAALEKGKSAMKEKLEDSE